MAETIEQLILGAIRADARYDEALKRFNEADAELEDARLQQSGARRAIRGFLVDMEKSIAGSLGLDTGQNGVY